MGIWGFNIERLIADHLFTILFALISSAGFILCAFLSRRIWLWYGAVVVALEGLAAIFQSQMMLRSMYGLLLENDLKIDGVHLHLVRCIGIVLVVNALTQFRLSDRDFDSTIFTSVVFTRVVFVCLVLCNYIYNFGQVKPPVEKSAQANRELYFYMVIVALVSQMFAGLVQLYRCPSWGGYPEALNKLNFHIRLDYVCTLISGLFTFAFPEKIIFLETTILKPNVIHLDLMRLVAISFIISALLMGRSTGFLRDNDKVTLLECRIVQNVFLLILALYSHNFYSLFTVYHIFYGMLGLLAWTINAGLAYLDTKRYPKLHDNGAFNTL